MRLGGLVFAPRLVPTVAAFAMIALTVSLGRWQYHRAQEKTERQALLDARNAEAPMRLTGPVRSADAILYRRVQVQGRYVPEGQVFIDNRIHAGMAGFEVVTPLAIGGAGALVLVDRGWVARTAAYPAAPGVPVPAGDVVVEGIATLPPARFLELSDETVSGNVWQNLRIDRYAARAGREVLPVVVHASPPGPGMAFVEEHPEFGADKHREYMLTWFSLAATVAALWVGLNLERERR